MATSINTPIVVEFIHVADGALDFTPTRTLRVFDARGRVVTAAAVATSFQISNVGNAITALETLGNNVSDLVGRASVVNDANYLVAVGGTLRSTLVGAGTTARTYVYCYTT